MERNSSNIKQFKIPVLYILIFVLLAMILFAGTEIYRYMNRQLYYESVTQLEELSKQLFEKLDVKLQLQWSHLEKVHAELENTPSMTERELARYFEKFENDLSPIGEKILFRAIDSDGYYYTTAGRQGLWTGANQLRPRQQQSFIISNWLDDTSYMVFARETENPITVDGHEITYLVLLRDMIDMQPFFHSSVFGDRNVIYIHDSGGFVLYEDGELDGIELVGRNIYHYMDEMRFPHLTSFDDVLTAGASEGLFCTDMTVGSDRFYLVYSTLPEYDWGVLMVVDAADVAVSANSMVSSILRIYAFFSLACVAAIGVIIYFSLRVQRDRKLMEIQESANEALQAAQEETSRALAAAQAATKAKSQFLSNMSHDIRTPMNAIIGVTSLMEHEADNPEKQRYYIKKLQTSGRHMLGLINDILDMSKIESGEVQLTMESVKMAEQAGQIESIIRSQSSEKGQSFTIRVHEVTHEYLIGDCIRIRQIFLNLLTNAVKYTPSGGSISFEISELPCEDPDYATIRTSVIDNGLGMSEDFQKHIFEPFTREKNSTINKIQGTGLGMSITKSLVDLMGGTITVQSELGKGSRFDVTLTLPIDKDAMTVSGIGSVLLVSDEEMLAANVKAALRETSVDLRIVADLDAAVAFLRDTPADVILLSGYLSADKLANAVRLLRQAAKTAELIFCCDYAHRESVREALVGSGVDGLVARPFFFENFLLAVEHSREDGSFASNDINRSPLCGKRFLCAEDNDLNAEILEALLDIHGAYCTICPDGAELVKAFAEVRPGDYDALLVDVQMPNMNGMDATRAIRSGDNPLGKTIPIIAMTANAFSTDVQECLDAGMDAHLAKPLDINALEQVVNELVNKISIGGGKFPNKQISASFLPDK